MKAHQLLLLILHCRYHMQRVRSLGEVEERADVLRRKEVFYANTIFNKTEEDKKLKYML